MMMKKYRRYIKHPLFYLSIAFAILVIFMVLHLVRYRSACVKFDRMINGASETNLVKFEWFHYNKIVVIENEEVLQYIVDCFSRSRPHFWDTFDPNENSIEEEEDDVFQTYNGMTSHVTFYFDSNESFHLIWAEALETKILLFSVWWDTNTREWNHISRNTRLHSPIPSELLHAISFMGTRASDDEWTEFLYLRKDGRIEMERVSGTTIKNFRHRHDYLGYILFYLLKGTSLNPDFLCSVGNFLFRESGNHCSGNIFRIKCSHCVKIAVFHRISSPIFPLRHPL